MSTNSNLFSQGGGGTFFEFETHAAFFTMLLIGGVLPGGEGETIKLYRQQSGSLGYETDDLLLFSKDLLGIEHKSLIQIKHGLIISESDETWEKVLVSAWKDFNNQFLFDKSKDRLLVIKDDMTQKEKKHLKELCNWSKSKTNESDFTYEVLRIKAKKAYYDLFKNVLQKNGITATAVELFEFFRCFDIWDYDFGNLTSVQRANFLNLIELSKAQGSRLHAHEIWNEIFQFVSSSDAKGGSFEWEKIPAKLTALFDSSYYPRVQQQLSAMTEESKEIVDLIRNDIGSVVLERTELMDEAKNELEKNQILIVAGEPGSGKSAIAKDLLDEHRGNLIALKADELSEGSLVDILKSRGVDMSVTDFFNHFPLSSQHIIYVDALEKLLEGEGKPFQQLLKTLKKHPDIKLIASCRKANFHLLEIKYFSDQRFYKQDIGFLSDSELNEIVERLPELKLIISNQRLSALIKVPKYLDFAYRAIKVSGKNFSEATEAEFVQDLWDIIIENKLEDFSGGMAQKRKEAFVKIAVLRAKKMTPFVAVTGYDPEAVEKLEKENIIVKSKGNLFAPAHDVLEDWALVRFVDSCFEQNSDVNAFFTALGTEPAMRRAYRLWVQVVLSVGVKQKISFFSANLTNSAIERFWQDESLIALLHSDYSETFFLENESRLIDDDWSLFLRIVHILRTACRENVRNTWAERQYVPVGPGWDMAIRFINKHKDALPEKVYTLLLLTMEDYAKIIETDKTPKAVREAGLISFHLLEYFKGKATYYYDDKTVLRCIKLIFDFSAGIKDELEKIFERAVQMDEKDDRTGNWIETRYYQQIITLALEGLTVGQLANQYLDLLIELAKKRWYYKARKASRESGMFSFASSRPGDEIEIEFGLDEEERSYSTPSAYETFILSLLRYHPEKAVDFIVEFTNNVTETFLISKGEKDNPETMYEMELPDGNLKTVRGYPVFWISYRGYSGGVPKLIESVLMALERYLIELGNKGESALTLFRNLLKKLYTESNSLFVTGVLSSVCQAHPALAGEWNLPLFSCKELFYFDLSRYTRDSINHSLGLDNNEFYKERWEADRWPHRTRFLPGLKGFISNPVLYMEGLGDRIFSIIDKLRAKTDKKDLDWRRFLDDMDLRTYKMKEVIEKEDGSKMAVFLPEYESEVAQKHADDKEKMPFDPNESSDSVWMNKVFEGSEQNVIEKWRQIYQRYIKLPKFIWHEHSPGLLAAIGIRDIWNELDSEEKKWCAETVFTTMNQMLSRGWNDHKTSVFDRKAVYKTFPLLLIKEDTGINAEKINKSFFELLQHEAHNDTNYNEFLPSASETIWNANVIIGTHWWKGLVNLAAVSLEELAGYPPDEFELQLYNQKLDDLTNDIKSGNVKIKIDDITFNSHDPKLLSKAVAILPSRKITDEGISFLIKMLELYQQYEETKDKFNRDSNQEGIDYSLKYALIEKIPAVILYNPNDKGAKLLENLLDRVTDLEFLKKALYSQNESLSFFKLIIESVFIEVQKVEGLDASAVEEKYSNFNHLWQHFDAYLTAKNSAIFSDLLLINTKWNSGTRLWQPIKDMGAFLEQMIAKYGALNIAAVVNLLTHPANQLLMPKGITALVNLLKNAKKPALLLSYEFMEKFTHRAYEHYLDEIKSDQALVNDYLWLLDQLILEGSSDAYWIREFMVSFRQKKV
jgi:hypothetical protein